MAPFIDGESQQIPGVDFPNHEFNVPTPVGAPSDPTAPAKYVITCDEDHDIYYEANDLETLNKLLRGNTDDAFGEGSYIVENNHYVLTFNDDLIFTSNSENLTFYGAHGKVAYWKVEGNGHTIKSNLTDMSSKGQKLMVGINQAANVTLCNIIIDGNLERPSINVEHAAYDSGNPIGGVISTLTLGQGTIIKNGYSTEENYSSGITVSEGSKLIMLPNSQIMNCIDMERGAAILVPWGNASIEIEGGKITGNKVKDGGFGVGGAMYFMPGTNVSIKDATISNNFIETANGKGGAIYSLSSISISSSVFSGNNVNGAGGAIYINKIHKATIEGSAFTDNSATGEGGAIFVDPCQYESPITDKDAYKNLTTDNKTTFTGNTAGDGLFPSPSNFNDFTNLKFSADSDVTHGILKNKSLLNNFDVNYKIPGTIFFDANGGIFGDGTTVKSDEYEQGEVITILDAPTREGYTFDYWKGSEYHPGEKFTVTEDHTFVAQWNKDPDPEPEPEPTIPEPSEIPEIVLPGPILPKPLTVSPPAVVKQIKGGQPAAPDTFTFRLESVSYKALAGQNATLPEPWSLPLPQDTDNNRRNPEGTATYIQIKGAGSGVFGQITYTKPGDYTYKITELPNPNLPYVFASTVYTFTDHVYEQDDQLVSTRTFLRDGQPVNAITAYFTNE